MPPIVFSDCRGRQSLRAYLKFIICKTVEECEKRYEAVRLQRDMEAKEKKAVKPKAKKAEAKPKLGTFDPEEAFRLALQRSYAVSESDDK